ncbi:uncharacterized protein LOC141651238 [Silene latifolia]|uniref:uncharacterized protein LOC141651238 n=1 Tax=Silene latifolia TaxID=37657 RepID=UPI003D77C8C3
MIGLTWNYRGLNNTFAPTIPKLRALLSNKYYDFVFLIETKCNASSINPMFGLFGYINNVGMDANGSSGGLWVGWKNEAKLNHVLTCNNFIILLVEKYNGLLWYLVLFYGAPCSLQHQTVLKELECHIANFNYPYLIMGDFNQVEYGCDQLSMNTRAISGAYDFNLWRINNQLVDIPFKGPRFTWCNNRRGVKRVYERIDRSLGSKDWFTLFPDTDCISLIKDVWRYHVWGNPSFRVARKLSRVRQYVKKWALDKRLEWKQKWEDFDLELERGMDMAITEGNDDYYTKTNEGVRRTWRNFILGIKDTNGLWVYEPELVGNMFHDSFFNLYNSTHMMDDDTRLASMETLLGNFTRVVTSDDGDILNCLFTAKEVRCAVFQMGALKSPGPDGVSAIFLPKMLAFY